MRNKFEQRIAKQLKKAKVKFEYESIKIPYTLTRLYYPDFIIDGPNGPIYIECKGYFRPEHRAKMAAVRKQHPDLDVRIVFYSNSRANCRWAEKHGYPYAIGMIPKEWLI